ncbi:hypothetical protein OCK74_01020 [Chitinophagaceae bacterium LB-8]|uniref:Uncharacterized protein n=1 Tax=Paraflavisolibacter caeni TaxID=2982496 RepID=A0A9X2XU27_9BACT|nr:hypothetical protein [Paraflavisolibacter caeni]MCU7547668.1 hypothetical protein [Paraflavisolibacter caeni]
MHRSAYRLTIVIVILALVASIGGLLIKGLYHDNLFVNTAWRGTDLVTLIIALPLLIVSLIFSMRGSQRAQLVWLGMVDYMLYNYAFYLFGSAFNAFFLVYVAIFTLSIFTLIFGLLSIDVEAIGWKFKNGVPAKWISGYMFLLAFGLLSVYTTQIYQFISADIVPSIIIMTGHPTSIVFALDLSLLVPPLILGGIWLWKRLDWGFILAGILLSKGAVYPLSLALGAHFAADAGIPGVSSQIGFWIALSVSAMIACLFLLGNMSSNKKKQSASMGNNSVPSVPVSKDILNK